MATSVKTLLTRVKSNLAEATRQRYLFGTATGGSTTTILASTLNSLYPDSAFVGAFARITSGNGAHFNQPMITTFSGGTFTVTVAESFGITVTNGMTFELFDKGLVADYEILSHLNDEQVELVNVLSNDALQNWIRRTEVDGTTGFAPFPSNMIRLIAAEVGDGVICPIYQPEEAMIFVDDAFVPGTSPAEPVGFVSSKLISAVNTPGLAYRPANNADVFITHIPKPDDMTLSGNASLPDDFMDMLVLGATARALLQTEDHNQAANWLKKRDQIITAKNSHAQIHTKLR